MYRGTTPILTFRLDTDLDLEAFTDIWVSIKVIAQTFTWGMDRLDVDNEEKTISLSLTQEETLAFHNARAKVQLRLLDDEGRAFATPIKEISINEILQEGVIGGESDENE